MRQTGVASVKDGRTYRERRRAARRREFLDTALAIALRDGLESLTMQRVTEELECSNGSIYQYFATKGALVAEMQHEALVTLGTSVLAGQANLAEFLHRDGADDTFAALARLVAAIRFWVLADDVLPGEVELSRMLFVAPGEVIALDEAGPALPSGLGLISFGCRLFDDAAAAGAIRPGDSFARTVTILAGTTGVLLTAALDHWEHRLRDTPRLADDLVTDLLLAWGADPERLRRAELLVAELHDSGRLVPVKIRS